MKTTAIYCDGPQSDIDYNGEEIPVWIVFPGDDDGCETGPSETFYSAESAVSRALEWARSLRVEPVIECTPA